MLVCDHRKEKKKLPIILTSAKYGPCAWGLVRLISQKRDVELSWINWSVFENRLTGTWFFLELLFMLDNPTVGPRQLIQHHRSWYFCNASPVKKLPFWILWNTSWLEVWLSSAIASWKSCKCLYDFFLIDHSLKYIKNSWMFNIIILLTEVQNSHIPLNEWILLGIPEGCQ